MIHSRIQELSLLLFKILLILDSAMNLLRILKSPQAYTILNSCLLALRFLRKVYYLGV